MFDWIKKIFKHLKTNIKIGDMGLVNAKVADEVNLNNHLGCTNNNFDNSRTHIAQQNFNNTVLLSINYPEAINKALSIGNQNAASVGNDLQKLLEANHISKDFIQEKLYDPEIVATLAEANKIAYKTNNCDKRKILSDLIYKKITSNEDEVSNTLSLCIRAMENLTRDHLKAIAFLYLFHSNYVKNKVPYREFKNFHNKYIAPLIDFPTNKISAIGITIISNGAAVTYTFGTVLHSYISSAFFENGNNFRRDVNPDIRVLISHLSFIWNELGTSSASLTPLGECLGKIYLDNILGLNIEIDK